MGLEGALKSTEMEPSPAQWPPAGTVFENPPDGSAGARPSLSYDANPSDVVGAFEANSSDDASPIGYLCSFSAGAGEATGLRAKVYVFSGALG